MPTGALGVTLSASTLSSHAEQSGDILYAVLDDVTLASGALVLLYGSLSTTLDSISTTAIAKVENAAKLSMTLDSIHAETFSAMLSGRKAPYEDVISWTGHPLTGSRVRVRTGNLFGIFGEDGEYGLFAGDGWDEAGGVAPLSSSKYIRLGSYTNEFHNIPIKLYDGDNISMQMEPDAPSFSMGNPLPSGYGVGTGLWQGKDDGTYKWRIGDPSASGSCLSWNGSGLSIANGSFDISGASGHLAFGDPPPTSPTSGTGIWIDRSGLYGINDNITQIFIDALDGILYVDGGTEFGVNPILGNLTLTGDINVLGGTISIGSIDEKIALTDRNIISYTGGTEWYMLALDIRGNYGIDISDDSDYPYGMGIGDSNASGDYLLYYDGTLTIKGSLTAGSGNVFIDKDGIIVVRDTTFTPLIRYGESKTDINFTISGSVGVDNVTGDVFAYGNDVGDVPADVETDLMLRSVSDVLAKSILKASNESESVIATVSANANSTASSVVINANEVIINGGKVQSTAIAGGIPVADGTGKIDPSWLPTEEEPPAETGEYLVPVGAAVLWGGVNVPDANWEFVTALDGYFAMGASVTDLLHNYGSTTHNHTNPSALSAGGHNNHTIHVKDSSYEVPAASTSYNYPYADVYIVGAHTHTGTGSNESTAGAHTHTSGTMTAASNMPLYRRFRWIRPKSTDQVAPIGAIVMQATGATMGTDWKICDGNNGTYNMVDRFAYTNSTGDATGGSNTHTHTSGNTNTVAGHSHTIDIQSNTQGYTNLTDDNGFAEAMGTHKHTATGKSSLTSASHYHAYGATGSASSKPPYIVLQFWQRVAAAAEDYFPVGTVMLWPTTSSLPATWTHYSQANGYIPKGPAYGESIGSTFGTATTGDAHYHSSGSLSSAGAHGHGTDTNGDRATFTYSTETASRPNWPSQTPTVTMAKTHNHTGEFYLDPVGNHTHSLSSANTSSTTALPPHMHIAYIVRETTGGTPQTYIKSVVTPTDHAIVRFNGDTGDTVQNSIPTIDDSGNISTTGGIHVGGTSDPGADNLVVDGNITYNAKVLGAWQSWNPTETGWTALPSGQYLYMLVGKTCYINIYMSAGTSDSASASLTLPFTAASSTNFWGVCGWAMDNSATLTVPAIWNINADASSVTFGKAYGALNGWTASGTKRIICQFFYIIA